jgi:hypothetical protein
MSRIPSNVGVFYGQVDKRSKGWYWTDTLKNEEKKATVIGPFETKDQAVENALKSVGARQASNDEPGEKGAA